MPDQTRYTFESAVFSEKHHKSNDIDSLRSIDPIYLKCKEGHMWSIQKYSLAKNPSSCPYCNRRKTLPGVNDSATLHTFVAKQWDEDKNGSPVPDDLNDGSHAEFYWMCSKGHRFKREIRRHIKLDGSCPYCSGFYAIPGETDVATLYPRILDYWDASLNKVEISTLLPQSNRRVTLRCPLHSDHIWDVSVQAFVVKDIRCPYCSNKKVLPGFNDIATTDPYLAEMWDDDNEIKPTDVTHGSGKFINWKCGQGHKWRAKINNVYSNNSRCPYCSNKKALKGYNDFASIAPQRLIDEWDFEKNTMSPEDIVAKNCTSVWWKCDNGHPLHRWKALPKDRIYGIGNCRICYRGISVAEHNIYQMITSLYDGEVVQSDRSVIKPYELDIYLPEKHLAFEFNGVYWHTEKAGKDKHYHYNKWKMCKEKGIQLITIWEDDWRDKQSIVASMIAHKLGVSNDRKVFARNTSVSRIESPVAREFLDLNHMQGSSRSTAYFGLYDSNNHLVAASAWRKNKDTLYLDRYATSCTVVGGMGKLLKQGEEFAREHGCKQIVTFADHQVSDGNLYEKLGFSHDGEIAPDYSYLVGLTRKHKFGYRIGKFKSDPDLLYKPGMTESQLAELNGLERVWDCGKTRYIMDSFC